MGMAGVQFKIMPVEANTNFEEIIKNATSKIEELGGKVSSFEEIPIAFGLKSLTITIAFPEEKEIDEVENALNEIKNVSSAEIVDYRRALG
jgi:translation elongation factor aEF-1 beta